MSKLLSDILEFVKRNNVEISISRPEFTTGIFRIELRKNSYTVAFIVADIYLEDYDTDDGLVMRLIDQYYEEIERKIINNATLCMEDKTDVSQ